MRDNNVSWSTLFKEFRNGTGPTYSGFGANLKTISTTRKIESNPARPPAGLFALKAAGIAVYTTICISVNALVFYAASCVFVAPKNLLAHSRPMAWG